MLSSTTKSTPIRSSAFVRSICIVKTTRAKSIRLSLNHQRILSQMKSSRIQMNITTSRKILIKLSSSSSSNSIIDQSIINRLMNACRLCKTKPALAHKTYLKTHEKVSGIFHHLVPATSHQLTNLCQQKLNHCQTT